MMSCAIYSLIHQYISGMSKVLRDIFRYILSIYLTAYLNHISSLTQTFKCLLSHEIILPNLTSCDISLPFMDTEIFAAYAGFCLFSYKAFPR